MENHDQASESSNEWNALEHTLDRVVDELLERDMRQQPFAEGKLIPLHDYISLYQQIYNFMCQERGYADEFGSKLLHKYEKLVQRSIHTIFQTQVEEKEKMKGRDSSLLALRRNILVYKGEEGMEAFLEKLREFKRKMHVFSHTFSYMERYFIPRKGLPTLEQVANKQLNDQVVARATQELKAELAALAERRREGKPVNDSLFSDVVAVFLEFDSSKESSKENEEGKEAATAYDGLETFLLHKMVQYYVKKAAPQWPQNALEQKGEEALLYEGDFAQRFLAEKSVPKFEEGVRKVVEDEIVRRDLKRQDQKKLGISLLDNNANPPLLLLAPPITKRFRKLLEIA